MDVRHVVFPRYDLAAGTTISDISAAASAARAADATRQFIALEELSLRVLSEMCKRCRSAELVYSDAGEAVAGLNEWLRSPGSGNILDSVDQGNRW